MATAQFNAAKKDGGGGTSSANEGGGGRVGFFRRRRGSHRRSKSLGRVSWFSAFWHVLIHIFYCPPSM